MTITIPVLSNSLYDLSKFDFSFVDISIYDIESNEFEIYIESQQPDFKSGNLSFFNQIKTDIHTIKDKKYAIVQNNPKDKYDITNIYNVWKILLLIFPSSLQVEYDIHFEYEDGTFSRSMMTTYQKNYSSSIERKPLRSHDENLSVINEFIKNYFTQLECENFITFALESYLASFFSYRIEMQYLTLCIALESIIHGANELSYRLRRSIAILCGGDTFSCSIVYNNINEIYKLRSKMVHGEKYDINKISDYMESLRAITSTTIKELLVHGISSKKTLGNKFTELGYGDRDKISDNWKEYELNRNSSYLVKWNTLKK